MSEAAPPLRIGELAKATGTTPRTIRYYEELGLLAGAESRAPGSHRTYTQEDLERLQDLLRLKDLLGVSLDELRDLVTAETARGQLRREWGEGIEDPVRRREVLEQALEHVDTQLGLVARRRSEVAALEEELAAKRKRIRARLRALNAGKATAK